MKPKTIEHTHQPIYRVRAPNDDPLDARFSQRPDLDNRWNTPAFPALYCCCSVEVARAIVKDFWEIGGVKVRDLPPGSRPRLFEIAWDGEAVDVASPEGVAGVGLPPHYPKGSDKVKTRALAAKWHRAGFDGVVGRSASRARLGFKEWQGDHERWGEVAIFVEKAKTPPRLIETPHDPDWFTAPRPRRRTD